jgi:uncharacterized protein YceK
MRMMLLLSVCLLLAGCEKTIHEASATPSANHTTAETRCSAAISGATYSCPKTCT